jgi:regulator of sirC expression with transglutaminase-like and TPR domain
MDAPPNSTSFSTQIASWDRVGFEFPLDRACFAICSVFDQRVRVDRYCGMVDAIAARAAARCRDAADPYALMEAAIATLFEEMRFRGNEFAYYDPRNSLLSAVMDRRLGIPITLSILTIEVGRRLGLTLDGVGLPGHFLVRFPDPTSRLYIDAFRGGRILDVPECVALVERLHRGRITWRDDFLEPVPPRSIVKRVLLNLKNSLSQAKDYVAALAAIDMQLVIDPDDPTELRDRGIIYARLRRYDRAIEDLETYLRRQPNAGDGDHIRNTVQYLRQARDL